MKKARRPALPAIIIISIVSCIAVSIGALAIAFGALKANPAYRLGWEITKNDPAVIELFGSPVKDGFWVMGNVRKYLYGNDSANLQTSISGPKAHGMLFIYGRGKGATWQIQDMDIRIDGKVVLIYYSSQPEKGFQPYTPVP